MGGHFGNIVLMLQEKSKKADIKTKSKKVYIYSDIFQVCLFFSQMYTEQ